MTNFYFNLTEKLQGCSKQKGMVVCTSNPDGQPTVNRQSAVTLLRGKRSEKEQLSSTCLRSASDLPPFRSRYLRYAAMIFAVLVMSIANVGMAWGASGVINAASTTDLGKGNTPRYVVEQAGVGRLMKNATGSSSWSVSDGKLTTGSSKFALQTYNAISSIVITGYGTGSGRTFSSMRVGTTTGNYAAATATGTGTMSDTESSQTITITPSSTIAANSYVEITLSGNIYIYSVELVYASSCAATANAGADKSTTVGVGVAMAATAASSGYTGVWSIKAGSPSTATSQLGTTSSNTMTFTPNTYGTYTLVWTVTDNEDGSCSATDEATVTVPAPTHSITYTNLKGADNSANPTTYTEGVGVASFANLRHVVDYDFTGWSPSSISSSATTNQTIDAQWTARAAAAGTGTLTYALAFGSGTITTTSITRNNGALYDATDVSLDHTSFADNANKTGCSGKLTTTDSKDANNYVEVTFKIADGYTFTPTEVLVQGIAVTSNKTIEVELKDNAATPNSKSVSGTLTAVNSPTTGGYTVTLDFDASGTVTLEGTVTVKIFAYGATNHWRMGTPFVITGTVASAAPSCTAPNHVDISGNYHFFPGETLALTATAYSTAGTNDPIAAGDITGYQWQKYIGSDWENIVGETSATYTKANATTSDVGQYRCIVSTGATCSTTSGTFNAKCLQLYVYWDDKSDKCNLPFTKVDGTHATVNVSLENGSYTYYYKVTDGCGNWWGNDGTMTSSNCSGWNLNVNNHCGLTTTKAAAYTFNLTYNAGVDAFSMSVVYPSSVQVGGYNLYFANNERNWSNIHYRIGRNNWNSKAAMTLVPGTANLYQTTTIHYESDGGFEAWHIANNGGWSNGNSIYKTNTGDGNAITNATRFEGAPVPSTGLTVIPGSDHSTGGEDQNNNCEFYSYTSVPGMLTQNVAISPYSNGTITVNYTNTSNVASTLTSGNADLAHTVILTSITAVPDAGYDASAITINGNAYTANYVVTGATTIAASFTPHVYSITYKDQGNVAFSGTHTDTPSAHPTSHTYNTATNLNGATKAGYTFGGWYTSPDCSTGLVTSLGATDYTADITLYAKWTAAASLTALECNTLYKVADMVPASITLSETGQYGAGLSSNARFEVLGDPSKTDQAGGAPEMKNEEATINTIVFPARMYLKRASNLSEGIPTSHAVKFIVGESGVLDVYAHRLDRIYLKKAGGDATQFGTSTSTTPTKVTFNVTAGTYYIYSTGGSTCIYGIQLNCCTTPAAPTAFSAGSITSTGATFSITDGGDAASYDIYYSESSTAPTESTAATTTSTEKTKAVTGLTAETDYYAWVRSVCDADHKSAWVALSGSSFTTDCTDPVESATATPTSTTATVTLGEDARGYGYSIKLTSATGAGTFDWKDDDSNSYDLEGLTPSTEYTFHVKAYNAGKTCTSAEYTINFNTDAAAASQTALVINTLYEVPDMIPSGATLTNDDQFFEGLSANTKFELIGSASSSTTPKANSKSTNDKTIDGITFDDGSMWFKGNASLTSNVPTTFGLSFIVPEGGGKLYLYFSGTSTNIKLAKSGASGSKPSCASGYGEVDVTAGTYYLYGTGETSPYCFYGLKLCSTYSVSITTNNTTKTSGETGSTAAVNGKAYTATFTANPGNTLPSDVTVTIGGAAQTKGTGYTWTVSSGTGTLTVPAAKVTGNIVVTVTGTAAATYAINYECNGAESGCPSNTTASALPNPLPSAPTKDGYTFGGWFTDEDLTVAAVAGAAMTEATTLYAKWTVNSSSECITITNFATSNVNNTCGDGNGKIFYGYKGSVSDANALTITSNDGNDRGQNSGAEMRLTYNKLMRIYANNTTNAAPATFSNVTSVSFNWKFIASGNSGNTELTSSYTVKVGSTTIANAVSITGKTKDGYQTVTIDNLAQLSGYVEIKFGGSSSSYNVYLDDIEICTASMSSCTTPVIPTLSNQSLCEGTEAAAWNATQTASLETGETVSYQWQKKNGSNWDNITGATSATYDVDGSGTVTEAMAGTYRVVATVSKTGYASSTATKEVTLSVTDGIEVTGITADKATVYPTNSVTLTATANMDATWQWYTCANAEGDSESSISEATSASYTITSAGSAGTYYYKVKATSSCGNAERVYTLTVSAAAGGDCFHYVSVLPDKDISPSSGASIVTPTHATTLEGGTMKVGSQQITITKYGLKLESSKTVTITLDAALEAGNVVIVKGTAASAGNGVSINGVNFYDEDNKSFDVSYTVVADDGLVGKTALTVTKYSGSSYLQEIKITGCGASCTDPEVTASVDNSTACVGTSVTFTATGAHAEATYQWQKYSGGAWTDIAGAGAKAATYNIASVATTDALKYRVIASHDCDRTSNEVTLNVPVAPVFGSFTATRSVMATQALSITDVEASDATSYAWYKSADATYDAGSDTRVGTAQELLLAAGSEAAGATYYLFCVASNACGSTTSSAITVNVTALVEEDCATRGNESDAEFGFQNSGCGQGSYQSANCYTMNSNSKILIYSAPDGKYFKTMKVTIASSSASQASYNWSTNGGSSYTDDGVAITGVTTTLTEKTIDLSAHGNVNEVKIGRNFGNGESSGTLYVSKICFEYTSACTTTTVTPSTSSKTHTIGESFTKPTFTLGPAAVSSGTLTYSSSDEEIASVDESGNVTFNGTAGTVTITASYAGATIADVDYCASEGSYTITVSCEGGAPKIVAASSVNMSGCNSSVILNAKTQAGEDFAGGSYQWFHNGEEIDGATSKSYTAIQTGVYTVAYTSAGGCTSLSTNNATVTSTTVEPEVTKLVPFQYYHVDKTYTAQMKDRHLFSVKGSAAYGSTGKNFKLTMSRSGGEAEDITTTASIFVTKSDDGQVDTVMIDLNKLSGKYSEGDELVLTCAAVDCSGNVSAVYKDEITIHVIGATPTLALICSGSNKAGGTRKTGELTVGGDFLTGYNVADLCQQTGNTSFDANTEWGLYTRLKENYIVTPVNGYAVFNKLNYEPFDILLLTDYPKASKSDAAATVLDDMADLCDYRPMLSFKAHMVSKSPSKWAAKGFTTSPVVPKNTRTRLNIVCYAHPMFSTLKSTATHIQKDNDDPSQIVYTMLEGAGYESSKGLQGFELEAAENFVTIGLVHYNATPADGTPSAGLVTWTPGSEDRMLVTAVERQENIEARMIMFAVNCGAQSKFTETGRNVVLKCLEYLLDDNPLHVADCSFTFDNGAGNSRDAAKQAEDCPSCTGTKGDGKWSTAANWGPDYVVRPGKDTEVKIAAHVTVDPAVGAGAANNFTPKVRSVRILEGGQVEIPAGSYLEVVSTIRHQDGNDIYPTEANDIVIGSSAAGNGTLIFNNNAGDTKARVDMYSTAQADAGLSAAASTWQYIGTPHSDVASATRNYYDSWLYQYDTESQGWTVIPNGGPLYPFRGYCVTHPAAPVVFDMEGTLVATTSYDISVPANKYVVAANSWVAPIDINAITDDDMENISEKAIYFFNTGSDPEGDNSTTSNATDDARWAAGTYVSVPIHSAPYTGDDHIPSMQGFYVWSTTAGTLHLDYDRHVRGTSRTNKISGRMHAPKRVQTGDNEPEVLKIIARGNRYDDRLVVLEREDYTRRYDSGWDGEAWGGSDLSPMVYITNEAGVDEAVSAIPEFEGTVITFRAGEDSEYRFEFTYSEEAEPLYLLDTDNNTYTQVVTGNEYYFTTYDKSPHKRFVLTRKAPQIATGTELTSDGEGANAKKLLIEDKMYILLNGMLYDATGKVVK